MPLNSVLQFCQASGALKRTVRTGWVRSGIPNDLVESVADHSWRAALMAMLLKPDDTHLMKMMLIHDLAEAIVGDITPFCGISPEDKHEMESNAILELTKDLPDASKNKLISLFNEYNEGQTSTAKFAKDLDKLEMILQTREYEMMLDIDLDSFFDTVDGRLKHEHFEAWFHIAKSERLTSKKESRRMWIPECILKLDSRIVIATAAFLVGFIGSRFV
eukprot:TRINITY_DN48222_c0_g1_i1.p1 TRINITY_DN48222_c0_g1~~TRINITY_DN48222_c0_g1_i1.p1  ORF type:complete len:218 (+),score=8.72 TRINITY_DN48222_c0_g1_i1:94-747(+)